MVGPSSEASRRKTDFSFKDARYLWSLVRKQQSVAKRKRKWLRSMIPVEDGTIQPLKRPKFLNEVYLAESFVRSDEVSCEKSIAHVERCFGFKCEEYNHHIVQDGLQPLKLQQGRDGSLSPQGLADMRRIINKLSNEALQAVANIATHNKVSFKKSRPVMKKVIEDHLPQYLTNLGNENDMSQLSHVLTNPFSYRSDSVNITTPLSPKLLSSINQALKGLDNLTAQALIAMRRKLNGISFTPEIDFAPHINRKKSIVTVIRNQYKKMISKIGEGGDLPKNLAKALSVMNLFRKQELKCMDISQVEFYPFSRKVVFLQNDVMNAIWSIQKLKKGDLKLLGPILHQGSKDEALSKTTLRRYLMDCLFECDEGALPDEALRTIAFCNRMSACQKVELTEQRKDVEIEGVLNVSSSLRALVYHCTGGQTDDQLMNSQSECQSDEQLMSLGFDDCSANNDFVLTEGYYNFGHQKQRIDEACSSSMANPVDVSGHFPSGAGSNMNKPTLPEVAGANEVEVGRSPVSLSEVCDETATLAHKLLGKILENKVLVENKVNGLAGFSLDGSTSHGLQEEKNQKADIVIKAIENVLPNLSKSCMDKVRRIFHDDKQ
ncbi:uncharacterized protein LOC102720903 [Oryza brachyantha]|uniref:Uncharacterized protein n=1 Tax=Oryza brachyantha TaxID=4533 RepID=J3MVH9_ORYBR|nr:uncharacterized protein LOC102720903 [Oryza brachyantha]XP_015696900.1 uncharacterized protein LOC102720903 [Oryza brachyantha]